LSPVVIAPVHNQQPSEDLSTFRQNRTSRSLALNGGIGNLSGQRGENGTGLYVPMLASVVEKRLAHCFD
jgi:hypothetical protein